MEPIISVSIASSSRQSHPGLPMADLFKLFRAALKDDGDIGDLIIRSAYEDIALYDRDRARRVMELVVRRDPLAPRALYALLAEARAGLSERRLGRRRD
jgi:hypothetical protein